MALKQDENAIFLPFWVPEKKQKDTKKKVDRELMASNDWVFPFFL
jgi:hypothetical protein